MGLGRLITAEGYGHTFDIMASGFLRTGQWGRGGARLAVGRSAARCERARSRATDLRHRSIARCARWAEGGTWTRQGGRAASARAVVLYSVGTEVPIVYAELTTAHSPDMQRQTGRTERGEFRRSHALARYVILTLAYRSIEPAEACRTRRSMQHAHTVAVTSQYYTLAAATLRRAEYLTDNDTQLILRICI